MTTMKLQLYCICSAAAPAAAFLPVLTLHSRLYMPHMAFKLHDRNPVP